MGDQILRCDALKQTKERLLDLVENVDGFAEVFPEDKFDIVALFQTKRHITGMTGDGVNDAPALRKANVGFAVEGATPAAQGAASVILLTPGLSVIITAIKRSRKIFQRLQNYLIYRVFMSVFLLLFFFIAISWAYLDFPPVLIIFMCLILDLATMSLAYDKVFPSAKPNRWQLLRLILIATVIGCVAAAANLVFLALVLNNNVGLATIQHGVPVVCYPGQFGNTNTECRDASFVCKPLLSGLSVPASRANSALGLLNLHPLCAVDTWAAAIGLTAQQYSDALLSVTSNPYSVTFNGANAGNYGFHLFSAVQSTVPEAFNFAHDPYKLSDFPYSSAVINTLMFLVLCLSSQFSVYVCRVDGWFFTRRPGFVLLSIISSEMFFTSIVAAFFRAFPYWDTNCGGGLVRLTGLAGNYIGVGWLFGFIVFAFMELGKMFIYKCLELYDAQDLAKEKLLHAQEERRRRLTVGAGHQSAPHSGGHGHGAAAPARSGSTTYQRATVGKKKDLHQPLLGVGGDSDL